MNDGKIDILNLPDLPTDLSTPKNDPRRVPVKFEILSPEKKKAKNRS